MKGLGISESLHYLYVVGVSVELHFARDVEVDPGGEPDPAVVVHADGGGADEVRGDPEILGLS